MNVAITRAKHGLFIVGKANTLTSNKLWADLIIHSQNTKSYVDIDDNNIELSVAIAKQIPNVNQIENRINLKRSREEGEEIEYD